MEGRLVYRVRERKACFRRINLTLCASDDVNILHSEGVPGLRKERIARLLDEARREGVRLSYRDLSLILLTSRSTLKRDMRELRERASGIRRD